MRRVVLAALVAAALFPGCLCIAEFPDYLVAGDQGERDQRAKDAPAGDARGDAPRSDGGAREARAPDQRADGPRRERQPDGPRVDQRRDIVAACNGSTCNCTGCACTDGGACKVPCGGGGATCPPGVHCLVSGGTSCTNQIFCGQAAVCTVTCSGAGACTNQIHCGNAKQCFVTCLAGACNNHINCGAGYCEVRCKGVGSCANNVACDITSCGCLVECDPSSCGGPGADYLSKVNCLNPCKSANGCNACVKHPCFAP
jgi:hypothetical protein